MSAPCRGCGRPGSTVEVTGLIEATMTICGPCFDSAVAGLEVRRRQFEELLSAGVSRTEANRIMISRIDGDPLV